MVETYKLRRRTIIREDNVGYTQSGWDIAITEINNGISKTDYYEVKTHSSGSIKRNTLRISNSQMKMALSNSENYHILKVICNLSDFSCRIENEYENIGKCIADGKLNNNESCYYFSAVYNC